MNTRHLLIIWFWMAGCALSATAQSKQITIAGHIDLALLADFDTDTLFFNQTQTTNNYGTGTRYPVKINRDGNFNTTLPLDSISYLAFELRYNNRETKNSIGEFRNISMIPDGSKSLYEMYLFTPGDSISLQVDAQYTMLFSGKGSEKLNCQWQMYNISYLQTGVVQRGVELFNQNKLAAKLSLEEQASEMVQQQRLAILESYRDVLSDGIYKILRADMQAMLIHKVFLDIGNYGMGAADVENKKLLGDYFWSYLERHHSITLDSTNLGISAYYPQMVYSWEFNKIKYSDAKNTSFKKNLFNDLYTVLKKKYTGRLRDRAILACYQMLAQRYSEQSRASLNDALETIKDKASKEELVVLTNKIFSVHEFTLADAQGKVHKLSDYRGKLIMLDFWFTGCGACEKVAAAMKPIIAKFRDKNIAFITISIDKKERWLKSLAKGDYTTEGEVNLTTNGSTSHSVIKDYRVVGYPTLVLIGKNGKLITTSPPRPDTNEEHRKAFIKLLEANL